MSESQNQVHNLGVTAWAEKSKKKRYEIGSVEKSGKETRVFLDVFPGGPSKDRPGTLFLCWEFTQKWPDEKDSAVLAEISVVPAANAKGDQIPERKLYVLAKSTPKGQQYISSMMSPHLSKGIPLNVYLVNNDELILAAKLDLHRLRAAIDEEKTESLLMEANKNCHEIPEAVLLGLLETGHPPITFQFDFFRRKKTSVTTIRTTPPAEASSKTKKRPRPTKRPDEGDLESDPQYQPRHRRRREGSVIDLRSPDSKIPLSGKETEPGDQLAILEELEREEIELEQEASRKIQEKRNRIKKLKKALAK